MPLLLLLLCLPLVEIALFVQVGQWIGIWPTLALVIASTLGGVSVMRGQGAQSLARLSQSMDRGEDPTGPLAHGALIMIAGILLMIPGFFTSICGILLLIPPIRRWMIGRGAGRMTVRATRFGRKGPVPGQRTGAATGPGPRPADPGGAIDAEYEVIGEEQDATPRPGGSGWTRPH